MKYIDEFLASLPINFSKRIGLTMFVFNNLEEIGRPKKIGNRYNEDDKAIGKG